MIKGEEIMNASQNRELQTLVKEFKKGHRVPNGYKASFYSGIYKEDIHANYGKNCGQKIGETKCYEEPRYKICKDEEHLFSIEAYDGHIIVMGDSNSEEVRTWEQAFEVGLNYFENGY